MAHDTQIQLVDYQKPLYAEVPQNANSPQIQLVDNVKPLLQLLGDHLSLFCHLLLVLQLHSHGLHLLLLLLLSLLHLLQDNDRLLPN